MNRAQGPTGTDGLGAVPGRPGWESGAGYVESRSGVTRTQDHRSSGRRPDVTELEADRASLSREATLLGGKITNEGPASACPPGATDGPAGRSAERTERLRAFAREWAEKSPPWSERKWQEVNLALGYRLKES